MCVGDVPSSLKGDYTMANTYKIIIAQLHAAERELFEMDIDRETANAVVAAWPEIDADVDAWSDYYQNNQQAIRAHNLYGKIDGLKQTLETPLAMPLTRYVITDGPLVSPAGFSMDSGVYVRNDHWIETDRLPRHWDGKAYDMEKVRKEMAA